VNTHLDTTRSDRGERRHALAALLVACALLVTPAVSWAQGSIFGTVQNADLSNPPVGTLLWVGFLDNTDEEIRIDSNIGAGYDGSFWFDDFQNYSTEVAGNPYDYIYVNTANGQYFRLEKTIPNNSFQQENILLAAATVPARPTGLVAHAVSASRINISWNKQAGITYHVYRRATANNGAFRRIDDPTGNLANLGTVDSFFVDATSDGATDYTYLIIGQNASNVFSAHSLEASIVASTITGPAIVSVAPNSGSGLSAPSVVITGSNFDVGGMTVTFGGVPATAVTVVTPFKITCTPPNHAPGAVDVVVTNTASALTSTLVGGFTYLGNTAPVLAAIGPRLTNEGQNLNFNVSASDPDGTTPTLIAVNVPSGATFLDHGNATGTFNFTPNFSQAGVYPVTFIASDGTLADSEIVNITVNDAGNQRPVLATIGARNVNEGVNLTFGVNATEPDGDTLILSAVNLPAHASFTDNFDGSGVFSFDPDFTQSGLINVTFIASDGFLADSEVVPITVNNVDRPPVLSPIGPKVVTEGQGLAFPVLASDPDGTVPTLTAQPLPSNATFNDNANGTGTFSFNPNFTQSGPYSVLFIASDGTAADSELVAITVNDAGNQPPVLAAIGNRNIPEGQTLSFRVSATDVDGPALQLSAINLPLHATFTDSLNGAGGLVFATDFNQGGNAYAVTFIASDGSLADSEQIFITVIDQGNLPPVFDSVPPRTINEGDTLALRVHATDPEGSGLILGTLNSITNMTFVDSGNGSGSIRFLPSYLQAGIDTIKVLALDFGSPPATATLKVIVTVQEKNLPPNLYAIGNRTLLLGDSLRIRVVATDSTAPAGNQLFMAAINLPANATFQDSGNGIGKFRFKPTSGQVGPHQLTFLVTDNGTPSLADFETVTITVQNQNQPPVLATIGSKAVNEGDSLSFGVSATDPDGTIPTLSITTTLPPNAAFVDSGNGHGSFSFKPTYLQAGLYQLNFRASDGLLHDDENVLIQVREAGNQAPILATLPDTLGVLEGNQVLLLLSATDPESQAITLTLTPAVPNAALADSGNGKGLFSMTPDFCQADTLDLSFIATDALGAADTARVVLVIADAGNHPPIIAAPGSQQVIEKAILNVTVSATDPDCTTPHLFARPLPPNSAFSDNGDGTGVVSFAPDYTGAGNFSVYIVSVDAADAAIRDSVLMPVTILDRTQAPRYVSSSTNQIAVTLQVGQSVTIWYKFEDPDGPAPKVSAINATSQYMTWADSGGGLIYLTYAPPLSEVVSTKHVNFVATDSVYDTVAFVTPTQDFVLGFRNSPPVLDSIGPKSVMEGDSLVFLVHASDSNGFTPAVSASSLPSGATFSSLGGGLGRFRWLTTYTQAGNYFPLFRAQDATTQDTERVHITVLEAGDRKPLWLTIFPTDTITMSQYAIDTIGVRATDLDNPILTLSVPNLPPHAVFLDSLNNGGRFIFDPDSTNVNHAYNVLFVASDGTLADTSHVIYKVISFRRGDWNNDGIVDVLDVVSEINYAFRGAPPPVPFDIGDLNANSVIDIIDVVILIDYAFRGGPPLPP